jgi:hypothetical protein
LLIPDSYMNIKKTRGRSLNEIGVANVAFIRSDALEALESLKGSQAGVLGGDVLKVANGKAEHTYDNWHIDKGPNEYVLDFLKRSIAESDQYIRDYPDPEDGTILYALVVSELGL